MTLTGHTMAAVPQANTSLHSPLDSCRRRSPIGIALSMIRQPDSPASTIRESRVTPGRIESLRTGVCNSSPITANKFIPDSSSMFWRVIGSSHSATVKPCFTARVEASNDAA